MKFKTATLRQNDASMGRSSADRENLANSSVSSGEPNRCVIYPAKATMVAESIERKENNWFVQTKFARDLIVKVEDSCFHLHKVPMVSRSGYLNRLVFEKRSNGEKGDSLKIQLENLPGGAKVFELIVKFCYGWKIEVTAANIAPLYCAAHLLEMSDDLQKGNLISKTEAFLNFVMFSSWKETFQILKSCESISSTAKELQIFKRCSHAIAWKACTDTKAFPDNGNLKAEEIPENWWFEDVSLLRIDHFIEVIESIKRKGMKPKLVGSCIADWTKKWLSRVSVGLDNLTPKHLTRKFQRVTTESLVRILPVERNSVSCNFLLHLLKLGLAMKIDSEILVKLERRAACILEQCSVSDLLVKNYGDKSDDYTVYDVGIVIRLVQSYVTFVLQNPAPSINVVGRLVDGYLTLIAGDRYLTVKDFKSLAEALPKATRHCHDNLYRAMDMYLKAHPSLTEEERTSVCKALECRKLSDEARQHVMKNNRLPLQITTQLILLEQVNLTRPMTAVGSHHQRTKTQTIIRVSKGQEKGWMTSQKEIKMLRKEVEMMKVQLNQLEICKTQIQKQVKGCFK